MKNIGIAEGHYHWEYMEAAEKKEPVYVDDADAVIWRSCVIFVMRFTMSVKWRCDLK